MYTTSTTDESRTFIVAELSANHGHRLETALATVRAAKAAGADAIKIQTYTPDTITLDCDNEYFQIRQGTIWDGTTLYKLYKEAYTPWNWHKDIFTEARKCGLIAFSTPFDHSAIDYLEELGNPIYKIASFEINDIPLIEHAASMKKPMILSTGVATLKEIEEAVATCRRMGNDDITLLKCTSSYPAPVERANLRTIPDMAVRFGVRAGLSDHTVGSTVALAAVALGATVVEKHFIVDSSIGGPDASFSMEPRDFKDMVDGIRAVEKALGHISYDLDESALKNSHFKRSLFVAEDISSGEAFTNRNVRSVRPNIGLPPSRLPSIIGRKANRDIQMGTPLCDGDIA
jgi:pseudaminic acid synthase